MTKKSHFTIFAIQNFVQKHEKTGEFYLYCWDHVCKVNEWCLYLNSNAQLLQHKMQNVFHLWRVFNDSSVVFFQAQNIYVNLKPIVHSHVFGLPLPFKIAIQLFGILHHAPFSGVYFKIRAFVSSTKSK